MRPWIIGVNVLEPASLPLPLQVFGVVFIALSVWLQKNLKNFKDLLGSSGEDAVYACVAMGACLTLVAILGAVGAFKRKSASGRCMLQLFAVTMFVVLALEVTVSVLMFTSGGWRTLRGVRDCVL